MKKALILTCLLLIAGIVFTAAAVAALQETADKVTYRETVLYGDVSALAGTEIQTRIHLDNLLFWDTVFRPGETDSETSTLEAYQYSQQISSPREYSGVQLSVSYSTGWNDNPAEEVTGLRRAFNELKAQTAPGEEKTRVIRLIDYCEYYPLQILLDFEGYRADWDAQDPIYEANLNEYNRQDEYHKDLLAIQDFFRIPVLPEETLEIHLSVNARGNSYSWGLSHSSKDADSFPMNMTSVQTNGKVFLAFSAKSNKGAVVNTSLIPGGYGIYALPVTEEAGATHLDTDNLRMVYSMDPETEFVTMTRTEDGSHLLLFTKEDGHPILNVIDTVTMEKLQQLVLSEVTTENYFSPLYVGEDFLVLQMDWDRLTLLTRTEDGTYAYRFTADITPDTLETKHYTRRYSQFLYDGERLISVQNRAEGVVRLDITVTAYDESGMLCMAAYECSLNLGLNDDNYRDYCEPYGKPLTEIRFTAK